MSCYVIVSGLPAAGKSTVAAAVSSVSSLTLFDKDAYLEALFATTVPSTPKDRARLSRAADESLRAAVEAAEGGVVASWWKHPASHEDSGTPTSWLQELPGPVVEVYCRCPPEIAARRFLQRARHPGHFDNRWSLDELCYRFERAARQGPLGLNPRIEVDTSADINPSTVWPLIQQTVYGHTPQKH